MGIPFFSKKGKSTEQKASDTLLQGGVSLPFGGTTILAPAPTLATWFEVSALLSQLSEIPEGDKVSIHHLLTLGDDAEIYARVLACLIVGVKKGNQKEREAKAEEILYSTTVTELSISFFTFLEQANIQELFMLTTSLKQTNISKPTREVVGATAHGQE